MDVDDIRLSRAGGRVELSARVSSTALPKPFRLWYRFEAPAISRRTSFEASGDPFLAAVLMPSMAIGETVRIDGSVSPRLMAASRSLMEVYNAWWPELDLVDTSATREARSWRVPRRRGSACMFSLGVDSYYTYFKNADGTHYGVDPIESLVFVSGFDVRIENADLLEQVQSSLRQASSALGVGVLRVETNIRKLSDPIVTWNQYHGSAIASVGLALQRRFRTMFVAATYSYDHLHPWGSHPVSDPLWSTERTRFIHDGCELGRPAKTVRVASEPIVQRTLRTCWENRGNRYNCGECEKCLRTMAVLEGVDALRTATTYPDTLSTEKLAAIDWSSEITCHRFREVLDAMPLESRTDWLRAQIESHLGERPDSDQA